jgi:hypothetical protein
MDKSLTKSFLPLFTCLMLITHYSLAHGRRFAYTQQSTVVPAQGTEFEIWNTFRFSRDYFYRQLDTRLEFEYGLGAGVMTALYLNHEMKAFDSNHGAPGGEKATETALSLSNEWKIKLMDPAADPFGFALYTEGTVGLDEAEVEGKVILDKQAGPVILACNFALEHEWDTDIQNGLTRTNTTLKPSVDAGITWFLTSSFSAGAEGRYLNTVEQSRLTHSALFVGPSLSFASEELWLTFTFLFQTTKLGHKVTGTLDLIEFERYQARLLFSLKL